MLVQSLIDLSRRTDINSPVEIQVNFTSRPRPAITYSSGSPSTLTDFRDFPIIRLLGNTSVSVSSILVFMCEDVSVLTYM